MAAAAVYPALVVVLLCILGAWVTVALRDRQSCETANLIRPWASRGWPCMLSMAEQQEARARAMEVARLTVGEEVWAVFMRWGYIELPSAAEPGTCYRLRPARRVEIQVDALTSLGRRDHRRTRAYLCVYPTYELPAVEFLAQLYLRLRDDEQCVLATGRLQPGDGLIPNVF